MSAAETATNTGASQPEAVAAAPPANPSRANTAAAVQLGIAAATPIKAPSTFAALLAAVGFCWSNLVICALRFRNP